jgi:hypothetical protein
MGRKLSTRTIAERGLRIYRTKLKPRLERSHRGEIVVINVLTGDYVLGRRPSEAIRAFQAKVAGQPSYLMRVGELAVWTKG